MALKTQSDEAPTDPRTCQCGPHADVYDGTCRRCALPPGATDAEVVANEPKPYGEWTEDALRTEVANRRAAGETVDVADDATVEQLVAALEAEDASRPDAVFVTE